MENNCRMKIVFMGYVFVIRLLFIVMILLLFLYYLDNDLDAYNKKDSDRVDLQIKAKSISTNSKPFSGKTHKKHLYEASD